MRLCFRLCRVIAWGERSFLALGNLHPFSIRIVLVGKKGGIGAIFFLIREGRRRGSLVLMVGWYDLVATGAGDDTKACDELEMSFAAEGVWREIHDD